jgi:hypothetical protein
VALPRLRRDDREWPGASADSCGVTMVGVILGTVSNVYLDRRRDRHAATRERDQANAELLTTTIDLVIACRRSAVPARNPAPGLI